MSSEWETVVLGEILRQVKRPELVADLGQVPFAGVRWYAEGVYHRATLPTTEVKTKTLHRIDLDDIVYNRMWATKASFGRVKEDAAGCLVTNDFPIFVVDRDTAIPAYIELLFHQASFQAAASIAATGTTERRRLNERDFMKIPILLPSLEEQQRIVDLIGAVDDAIEAAKGEAAHLQSLFSSTLDRTIGGIPDTPDLLAQHFQVIDCEHKTAPASQTAFARSVGTSDIRGGRFMLDSAKPVSEITYREWTARAEPAPDDVVLTREAPVGQVALVGSTTGRLCLGQRTVLIRPVGKVSGAYLWASLLSRSYQDFLESRSIGQTVKRVNVKLIKELPIRIPSPTESERAVQAAIAFIDAIEAEESRLRSLQSLRNELLSALLSGAHRIPETYDELMGADSMETVGA